MPKEPEVPAKGSNHKLWLVDVSIQWLLYPILIVYFLPILALAAAALITDGFTVQDESLSFARIMASDFYDSLRQTIGVIFVPFLTAYAVQAVSSQAKVPISTAALFFVLLTFFVITIVMYGLIDIKQITPGSEHGPSEWKGGVVECFLQDRHNCVCQGVAGLYCHRSWHHVEKVNGMHRR